MKVKNSIIGIGKNSKVKKEFKYFLMGAISIVLGTLVAINFKLTFITMLSLGIFIFLFLKKDLIIYLIIFFLFFEAQVFSFNIFGARIRLTQALEVIALFAFFIYMIMGKAKPQKTPLDLLLWCYIFVNFISLKNAVDLNRSLKISILLLSLVLLYYVVINFLNKKEIFERAFNLLLYVGLVEVIYGLYQVIAGMCNSYLGINLPIGHAGIMHQDLLSSPWGRPYGTFVEPDWYGAIAMFYAILFMVLYSSNLNKKKNLYLVGMLLSFMGMILSFVRASWLGFFGAIILLFFIRNKLNLSRVKFTILPKTIYISLLLGLIFLILSPSLNSIIKKRFTSKGGFSITTSNVRFVMSKYAFKSFLKNPIFGNGPGSPLTQEGTKEYKEAIEAGYFYVVNEKFNASLLTTLLKDTGIIGAILFLLLCTRYLKLSLRNIPKLESQYQVISFAFLGGILGLFISFLLTHGFWIPFTWVFLGFNIAAIRMGFKDNRV